MSKVDAEEETGEQPTEAYDPSNPIVLEKYKRAATIAQSTLAHLLSLLHTPQQPPLTVVALCTAGDSHIASEVSKVYAKEKKMEKGIAFPTCVSINHIVGHASPLSGADNGGGSVQTGDVVKFDIGVHFDGYAAALAHTTIAPAHSSSTPAPKVTGKPADVISALSVCYDAIMRCIRPGGKSGQVSSVIAKVCADFGVNAVQGVLSHSLDRNRLDGPHVILNRAEEDVKVEEFTFAVNDVYAIDVVLSSGEGKPKPSEDDTTIYKRNLQSTYQLKMQVSRAILSTIDKQHRHFPFTLRSLDESKAKFAIKECRQHDLVHAYPVLKEKEGEVVGQCKWTVMVSERGAVRLCGAVVEKEKVASERKLQDDEVKKLLNQPLLLPASTAAASGAGAAAAGGGAAGGSGEVDEAAAARKKAAAAAKKKKQAAKKKAAAAATSGGEAGKDGGKDDGEDEEDTEEAS